MTEESLSETCMTVQDSFSITFCLIAQKPDDHLCFTHSKGSHIKTLEKKLRY